jgi:CRISPR-associated protein Csm4
MSDTFFGHFCWALLYEKGADFLTDFLGAYGEGSVAPVLFSSAFVSGMLPRPVLPPLSREHTNNFVEENFVDDNTDLFKNKTDKQKFFIGMTHIKAWNKMDHLTIEQWTDLKDDYSELQVLNAFLKKYKEGHEFRDTKPFETEVAASNTVSRISGTVSAESGGLFQREKIWYHKGIELDLYVEVNSEEMSHVVQQFLTDYLLCTGFGADKAIGMGELDIALDEKFEPGLLSAENSNARLSLSLVSFPGMECYEAFYRLKTKFGKLGGDFAVKSPTGGNPKPFKKPVLMYEPGAVFLASENLNNKPLLENVHSDQRIRHCGIPVTLPFKISEDISNANVAA